MAPRSSDLRLAGELLDLDDHELRRLERAEPDDHVDDSQIDVALRRSLGIALDEIGFPGRAPEERPFAIQVVHEGPDVEPELGPERLVVGLEYRPLGAAVQAFLD